MVAVPDTTLQVVEEIGNTPVVTLPWRLKAVELPWVHWVWSGPASLLKPSVRAYWMGTMKSEIAEEVDWEDLVLTMMVLMPTERQGSKSPISAVKSIAASTNALGR